MGATKLHVFDFDGTLFLSPDPPPGTAHEDWWSRSPSLSPPCVPERPSRDWWNQSVVDAAKAAIQDSDGIAVLVSGREEKFMLRVKDLLSQAGLHFAEVYLSPGKVTTDRFKMDVIWKLLDNNAGIRGVSIWEDRDDHLRVFADAIEARGRACFPHLVTVPRKEADCSAVRVAARYKSKKKDEDGNVHYEYSERQVKNRHNEKAERVEKLRKNLNDLRKKVLSDLKVEDPKTSLAALAVALMDETIERVGNDGSASEGHFGVTGWCKKHLTFRGNKAIFKYVGKSGVDQEKEVTKAPVVKLLRELARGKGKNDRLLEKDGVEAKPELVNEYLKHFDITAKDIRGLRANQEMCEALKRTRSNGSKLPKDRKKRDGILKKEFQKTLEEVADIVGHEPATLRSDYLVPGLEDTFMKDGTVVSSFKSATKTEGEREDEATQALIKPSPKKKPPRDDLRKRRIEVDDSDVGGKDPDLSLNYKRVASRIAMSVRVASRFAGRIPILVDVASTIEVRRKHPSHPEAVSATFTGPVILYRIFDGEELSRALKAGKITGGTYAVKAEREVGASWGTNLSEIVRWGNSQRGKRLGEDLFVARLNAARKRFLHLNPEIDPIDPTGAAEQIRSMDASRINLGLGASVADVSIQNVGLFKVQLDGRVDAISPMEAQSYVGLRSKLEVDLRAVNSQLYQGSILGVDVRIWDKGGRWGAYLNDDRQIATNAATKDDAIELAKMAIRMNPSRPVQMDGAILAQRRKYDQNFVADEDPKKVRGNFKVRPRDRVEVVKGAPGVGIKAREKLTVADVYQLQGEREVRVKLLAGNRPVLLYAIHPNRLMDPEIPLLDSRGHRVLVRPLIDSHRVAMAMRIADAEMEFEEFVSGKSFPHPKTKNQVKFPSLPMEEQDRIRKEWAKKSGPNVPKKSPKKSPKETEGKTPENAEAEAAENAKKLKDELRGKARSLGDSPAFSGRTQKVVDDTLDGLLDSMSVEEASEFVAAIVSSRDAGISAVVRTKNLSGVPPAPNENQLAELRTDYRNLSKKVSEIESERDGAEDDDQRKKFEEQLKPLAEELSAAREKLQNGFSKFYTREAVSAALINPMTWLKDDASTPLDKKNVGTRIEGTVSRYRDLDERGREQSAEALGDVEEKTLGRIEELEETLRSGDDVSQDRAALTRELEDAKNLLEYVAADRRALEISAVFEGDRDAGEGIPKGTRAMLKALKGSGVMISEMMEAGLGVPGSEPEVEAISHLVRKMDPEQMEETLRALDPKLADVWKKLQEADDEDPKYRWPFSGLSKLDEGSRREKIENAHKIFVDLLTGVAVEDLSTDQTFTPSAPKGAPKTKSKTKSEPSDFEERGGDEDEETTYESPFSTAIEDLVKLDIPVDSPESGKTGSYPTWPTPIPV